MKNVLIADDYPLIRLGMKTLVEETVQECRVKFAENNEELLLMLATGVYDLLIVDINMPGMDSVLSVSRLLSIQPDLKILTLSVNPESIFAGRYMKAGVYGYLQMNNSNEKIKNALSIILQGKRYFSIELMRQLSENYLGERTDNPFNRLSTREFEVAMLLLRGFGLNEVANALRLHTSTASTHKTRLFEKLSVSNVVGLVNLASIYHIAEEPGVAK